MPKPSAPHRGAYCPADGCPDCSPAAAAEFAAAGRPWPPPSAIVGLTAGEALEQLDRPVPPSAETRAQIARELLATDGPLSPAARVQIVQELLESGLLDPRPSLWRRLWTRVHQAWCDHSAATAHRIPGFGPDPVFERRCGRCGGRWTEVG